jgi:hypothetical protein
MAVSYGPNLGKMINALTGDSFDADFRALLRSYDALLQGAVISKTLTAPPGSPANGDRYIVGASATGAWATHDKAIAVWTTDNPATPGGLWEFYAPKPGWLVVNIADGMLYAYIASAWAAAGGGGGGGVPTQAGVPTGAGTLGKLIGVTDGQPGASMFSYVGSFTGLPLAVNWGTFSRSNTGSIDVPMQRAVTLGNYLVAVLFTQNASIGSNAVNTGWTALINNNGPTPGVCIAVKVAGSGEAGATTITPWPAAVFANYFMAHVVEIANFNATTPIESSYSGGSSSGIGITGLVGDELILMFTAKVGSPQGFESGVLPGRVFLGNQYASGTTEDGQSIGYAVPVIPQVVGNGSPSELTLFDPWGGCSACVVLSPSAGVVNYWAPIG